MKYFLYSLVLTAAIALTSANIDGRLLDLDAAVKEQAVKNAKLRGRIEELEIEVADLAGTYVENDENEEEEEIKINKRAVGDSPAFHAYLSSFRCYNNYETIVYDVEPLDEGGPVGVGVYDTKNGIFEPPTTGVYVFTWTIAAPTATKVLTELVIAGNVAGVMTTDSDTPNGSAGSGTHPATAVVVASVSANVHCFVRVRHSGSDCSTLLSDNSHVRTTFSAWKLFSQ